MKHSIYFLTRLLISIAATFIFFGLNGTTVLAATPCNGVLTGQINEDVVVPNGSNCTLENTIVLGSVRVESGDLRTDFHTTGDNIITGDFIATGVNNSFLFCSATVMGEYVVGGIGTFGGASGNIGGNVTIQDNITRYGVGGVVGGDVIVRGVQLHDSVLLPGITDISISDARILGKVVLQGNTVTLLDPDQASFDTPPIIVVRSQVFGSLKVVANNVPDIPVITGGITAGPIHVEENVVGGNADCRRNEPTLILDPIIGGNIIAGTNLQDSCSQ